MKAVHRSLAMLLVVLTLLPQTVFAAPRSFTGELEAAEAFAELLQNGETVMYINVPTGFDYTLCYRYLSMLYRDAYVFEYMPSPVHAYIKVVYNDAEKHALAEQEAERLARALIREEMTELEKYAAIHAYLRDNCEYDMHAALNQATETGDAFSAYGALIDGLAVCDGISAAFAMICRAADLPCIYVAGPEMNHSWNAVWYQGEVCHIDVTYDLTGGMGDRYFMVEDKVLARDHTWDREMLRTVTNDLWDARYISAYTLNRIGGLFRGSDLGWELDRKPTRAEAAIMLVRFLGLEEQALQSFGQMHMPFTDVNPHHAPYIALLYAMGLTKGTSPTTFSPSLEVQPRDYMTFMLRALGYSDTKGEFAWSSAVEDSLELGVLAAGDIQQLENVPFDRGMMAYVSWQTLQADDAQGIPLYERLENRKILNEKKLKEFLK